MKHSFLITIILLCSLVVPGYSLPLPSTTATDTLHYDRGQEHLWVKHKNIQLIKEYQNQNEFLYDRLPPEPESLWDRIKRWIWKQLIYLLSQATPALIFRYILIGGLLLFFVSRLLKTSMGNIFRPDKTVTPINFKHSDDPTQTDWAQLILEAIKRGQYQTAVRYLFLQTLKNLSDKDLIQWKAKKTNLDYYREIQEQGLKSSFKEIANLYEAVWYGDFTINEKDFFQINEDFQSFNQQLNPQHQNG
ncbi:MAG: DUF4129 domain-containing protein [Marinifilaceae bacterium]